MSASPRGWSPGDLPLLIHAFVITLAFRLLLWIFPLARLRRRLDRLPACPRNSDFDLSRVSRAVTSAGHRIPYATCLPRALAMQYLLRQNGIKSELSLGVARNASGKFTAHAWVSCDGQVVIGQVADAQYIQLQRAA